MREFKFRAWNKDSKMMTDIFGLEDNTSGVTSLKVMQWTGLTDINGVEIFEGDIVRFESAFNNFEKKIGTVKYCNKEASYGIYYGDVDSINSGVTIEVVGNIFENKELLE